MATSVLPSTIAILQKVPDFVYGLEVFNSQQQLLDFTSESSSSGDDTAPASKDSVHKISKVAEEVLSPRSSSCCGIHSSTTQSTVRCKHCFKAFCSGCSLFDIHSEVGHNWSCRSCVLKPVLPPLTLTPTNESTMVKSKAAEPKAAEPKAAKSSTVAPKAMKVATKKMDMKTDGDVGSTKTNVHKVILVGKKEEKRAPRRKSVTPRKISVNRAPSVVVSSGTSRRSKSMISSADVKKTNTPRKSRIAREQKEAGKKRQSNATAERKRATLPTVNSSAAKRARTTKGWSERNDDYVSGKQGKRLKRFRCAYCPKRFDQRSNLLAHIRSHTGEKPFTCKVCKRPFSQKSNMTRHLKVHKRP